MSLQRIAEGRTTLLLSGGGLKTLAFCGALQHLDLRPFRTFVGISAGSVLSLVLALGYAPAEAADMLAHTGLASSLAQTVSPMRVFSEGSLLDPTLLIKAIAGWMQAKDFKADGTFEDLRRHAGGVTLRVIVSTLGPAPALLVLDADSHPREQVLRAVRASTAVPLAFAPVHVGGQLCFDAGCINNLGLFACPRPQEVLALLVGKDSSELCCCGASTSSSLSGLRQLAERTAERMDLLVRWELILTARRTVVVNMPRLPSPEFNTFQLGKGRQDDIESIMQQGRDGLVAAVLAPELFLVLILSVAFGLHRNRCSGNNNDVLVTTTSAPSASTPRWL